MLVVVFPQPPFWLMIAMVRMANLPWFSALPDTTWDVHQWPAGAAGPVLGFSRGLANGGRPCRPRGCWFKSVNRPGKL